MTASVDNLKTYELADLHARAAAFLIDGVIVTMIDLMRLNHSPGFDPGKWLLVGLVYSWYFLTHHSGQTPGKRLLHICIVKEDGTALKSSDIVMRYIGYFLNTYLVIGWLMLALDHNYQGWHDKIAHTYVVRID